MITLDIKYKIEMGSKIERHQNESHHIKQNSTSSSLNKDSDSIAVINVGELGLKL